MTSGGTVRAAALAEHVDLTSAHSVVDVGGGQGLLVAELLSRVPHLRAVLADRPEAIEGADEALAERGVSARVHAVAVDFFDCVPVGGDVYILSRILHDWPDDACLKILTTCRAAMKPESKLCIVEQIKPGDDELDTAERIDLALKDLNMLVLVGGQERTLAEYTALLEATSLSVGRVHDVGAFGIIEAVPS